MTDQVIDTQRNAVYFYEHRTRRSSWDTPPQLLGWWERLREQTGLEFFWNSVSQNTVWPGCYEFFVLCELREAPRIGFIKVGIPKYS